MLLTVEVWLSTMARLKELCEAFKRNSAAAFEFGQILKEAFKNSKLAILCTDKSLQNKQDWSLQMIEQPFLNESFASFFIWV